MTMTRTQWMMRCAAAALALPIAAAHAEKKPTVVLVYGADAADEASWRQLALKIADEGYTVMAAALKNGTPAADERQQVLEMIAANPESRVLLVASETGSDAITNAAEVKPEKIKSLVFVSASAGANESAASTDATPRYFVHYSSEKKMPASTEFVYTVRAKGAPLTADAEALADTIKSVAEKKVPMQIASAKTKPAKGVAASTIGATHAGVSALK